jgi:hypothetical protein
MTNEDLEGRISRASATLYDLQHSPRYVNVDPAMLERIQLDVLSTVPQEYWCRLIDPQGRQLLNV